MASHRFLKVHERNGATVVQFTRGAFDGAPAWVVHDEISARVQASGRRPLHLDLGNVPPLSAAALGMLVAVRNEARVLDGRLTLINVRPRLYEVFRATRLTDLFDIRPAPPGNILVVEDDAVTREALKAVLEGNGYAVACAHDGRQALDRLGRDEPPALILLDLMMAGMDGWEFRREQGATRRWPPSPSSWCRPRTMRPPWTPTTTCKSRWSSTTCSRPCGTIVESPSRRGGSASFFQASDPHDVPALSSNCWGLGRSGNGVLPAVLQMMYVVVRTPAASATPTSRTTRTRLEELSRSSLLDLPKNLRTLPKAPPNEVMAHVRVVKLGVGVVDGHAVVEEAAPPEGPRQLSSVIISPDSRMPGMSRTYPRSSATPICVSLR